jgi:SAM-dependent methyltransferase
VDSSESAVAVAAERARGLPCRFEVGEVPPLPPGRFEVVLLLETMLAFRNKQALLEEIARVLPAGGRFAFTLEEGAPLTESERARMPADDTVWLTPLDEMHTLLGRAGLAVRWEEDWSESHHGVVAALTDAYSADSTAIAARTGRRALEDLLAGHRLWAEWLAAGRVRKFGLVAERRATPMSEGCAHDAPPRR